MHSFQQTPPTLHSRDDPIPPDETVGPIWLAVSSSLLALVLLTTGLRLWVRIARRKFGWDDATITISAVSATVRYSFGVMQSLHGNGRHRIYLSDEAYRMINMYGWYGQLFHFTSMAFLKVSICVLILRIKSNRLLRVLVYTTIVGVLATNMGVVVILLAECRPPGFWRSNTAKCWPNKIRIYWIYATIAHSVLSDILLSLIPPVVVWKVNIPREKKAFIVFLMSLGLIATGFGITRAAFLGVSEDDLSWTFCIVAIWSNLELFLGIVAANLPLTRAMYLHFRGRDDTCLLDQSNDAGPGYGSGRLRGDHFEVPSAISSKRRLASETRSSNSDIPLEPGIRNKTEYWWRDQDSPWPAPEEGSIERDQIQAARGVGPDTQYGVALTT